MLKIFEKYIIPLAIIGIVISVGGLLYTCAIATTTVQNYQNCKEACLELGTTEIELANDTCFCIVDGKPTKVVP